MADIIKSVGATGRDYATLDAAVAAIPANLVTADENWIFELYNDAEFVLSAGLVIGGHTTDATRRITFKPAAGQGFYDHANKRTNPLRYDQSKGVGVRIDSAVTDWGVVVTDQNVNVDGLQFKSGTITGTPYGFLRMSGANWVVRNVLMHNLVDGFSTNQPSFTSNVPGLLVNPVLIEERLGAPGAESYRRGFVLDHSGIVIINPTAIRTRNPGIGDREAFFFDYSSPLIRNAVSLGFDKFARNTTAGAGSGYNATDLASGNTPGTNNLNSLVAANQIVSITPDAVDARPKAGSALESGTRDQTYTADLDITEFARSITTPTRGAFEFSVSVLDITSTGTGATNGPFAANAAEESTAAFITLTANEPVTWGALGDADASRVEKINVTSTTVQLRFNPALSFESLPHANPFVVTVPATDVSSNLRTVTVNATVTNVVEPPGAPTIGTATPGNASASVVFTPAAAGTAPTVSGFTATATPGGATGTGATSPITVSGLTNGTAYTFTVHATNSDGNSAESAASNSVTPAAGPTINTQPTAQTAKIGATATFTAAATASTAPLTAQWQKDGVNISGATNTTSYARAGVVLGDHASLFRCTYSDAAGGPVFTNAAALTVAVTFINGPVPAQSGSVGSAASWDFSSYFAGGLSRTFAILLGALPAGMAQVGTTAVFSGTPTTAGSGTLVISSTDSASNSDLTGTISWTISSAGAAPTITVQPASTSVTAGTTASFSVTATGSALTYQWRRNGTNISGATSSTYTTPTTTVSGGLANSGDAYSVVVTGDTAPAVTSSNAFLTVTPGLGATIISSALKNNEGWVHALAPFKGYLRNLATGAQLLTKTGLTSSQDGTLGFFDLSLVVGADYELRWDRTDTGERGWEVLRAL